MLRDLRSYLDGLLFSIIGMVVGIIVVAALAVLSIVVTSFESQLQDLIVIWLFGFPLTIWLLTSTIICLYWAFIPAEKFINKHEYFVAIMSIGSFLGTFLIITFGLHPLLWFIPKESAWSWNLIAWISGETGIESGPTRWAVSIVFGFIITLVLWHKLYLIYKNKRQEISKE